MKIYCLISSSKKGLTDQAQHWSAKSFYTYYFYAKRYNTFKVIILTLKKLSFLALPTPSSGQKKTLRIINFICKLYFEDRNEKTSKLNENGQLKMLFSAFTPNPLSSLNLVPEPFLVCTLDPVL